MGIEVGLLQGVAEGIKGGMESYRTERAYQDQKKKEEEDRARQRKMMSLSMFEKGVEETPEGGFAKTADVREKEALAKAKEEGDLRAKGLLLSKKGGSYSIDKDPTYKPLADKLIESQIAENLAKARAAGQMAKNERQKTVPASEVVATSSAKSAIESLGDVQDLINQNKGLVGPGQGRVSSLLGSFQFGERGKKAAGLEAAMKQRAQVIGKYLEGGKLTDQDILRYQKQLPQITDTPEVAASKIESLRRQVAQRQRAELEGLGAAGYNVGSMTALGGDRPLTETLPSQKRGGEGLVPSAQAAAPSEEDKQALQWANANPKDPRSAAIRQRLGM